jgi:hypothetical protein
MVALSTLREVGDFQEANQFQAGKSQFECGFFAVAMAKSMAQVGTPPTLTVQQVIADAENWYAQYNGSNAAWNTSGMSTQQEYDLLHQVGLHYQETALDITVVKKWLEAGYPVLIAIVETSVIDLELGRNPYPWRAAGNHIILVTGVAPDGQVLVRDPANVTNLYDPKSLRPGPRKYDAGKLQLVSATVVVPPWMPRPASGTPPVVAQASGWVSVAQEQAARAEWSSTAPLFGGTPPSYDSGIARSWQARYRQGQFDGPPLSTEYSTVDWHDRPIRVQQFARRRCEWNSGMARWY